MDILNRIDSYVNKDGDNTDIILEGFLSDMWGLAKATKKAMGDMETYMKSNKGTFEGLRNKTFEEQDEIVGQLAKDLKGIFDKSGVPSSMIDSFKSGAAGNMEKLLTKDLKLDKRLGATFNMYFLGK